MSTASKPFDDDRLSIAGFATPRRVLVIVAALLIVLIAAAAVYTVQANQATERATRGYQAAHQQLQRSIQHALSEGYTVEDLAPITIRLHQIDSQAPPAWFGSRAGFYQRQQAAVSQLRGSLQGRLAQLLNDSKAAAGQHIDGARGDISHDQQLGVDQGNLQSMQSRLNALIQSNQKAQTLPEYRKVNGQAQQLAADAQAIGKAQQQENQVIQQGAQQLIAQKAGDINALRQMAQAALAQARNDASVAGYMNFGNEFKGDYTALNVAYQRFEHYAPLIGSPDVNQVALAAAAGQRYGGQVNKGLLSGLPAEAVLISFQDQHLWAYQHGSLALETPVTTGIRGVTDFGTDFGPMKLTHKNHPWTMHSPWPQGSPHWYKDTVVQYATFFTDTGESIHDAAWEPDSLLGPGSQYNPATQSHGCVHVPGNDAQWMFNWAQPGMAVIVYPGDGSPVANQMTQITTDSQGIPTAVPPPPTPTPAPH